MKSNILHFCLGTQSIFSKAWDLLLLPYIVARLCFPCFPFPEECGKALDPNTGWRENHSHPTL